MTITTYEENHPLPARPPVAFERAAAGFLLEYHGRTREAYMTDLRLYTDWCHTHDIDPLTATRAAIGAYRETMSRAGAAPATVARRLSCLSGFYAYALDEHDTDHNPVVRVRRPKVRDNTQSTGLSAPDARTLLAAARNHSPRAHAIVALLLFCGLRVSELANAAVTDLSYERGHRTLAVVRKGGHTQKMVIPPAAVDTLDTYLHGRVDGPLIRTSTGRPMDRVAIWRLLRTLAETALPHLAHSLHPHDLRHACATLALDAGAPLRDVQDLLGHADPRTTRRYDRARHNLDRSPSYALAGLLTTQETP